MEKPYWNAFYGPCLNFSIKTPLRKFVLNRKGGKGFVEAYSNKNAQSDDKQITNNSVSIVSDYSSSGSE